jgi:hypothetical protein
VEHHAGGAFDDVPPVGLLAVEVQPDHAPGLAVAPVRLDHLAGARHPLLAVRLDEPAPLVAVDDEVADDHASDQIANRP